jgi:hypothetical protein
MTCFEASVLKVSQLSRLADTWAESFDTGSGALVRVSLKQFLEDGWAMRYSLILLGRPGTGKTPACKAFARAVTRAWQQTIPSAAGAGDEFIVCSTLDSLRLAASSIRPGTSIICDEFTPIPGRGSEVGRRLVSADELKRLLSTSESKGQDFQGRYQNFTLPVGGRFLNCNCPDRQLDNWCAFLPPTYFTDMTVEQRHQMCVQNPHAAAIFKRALFCWVREPLVAATAKRTHVDDQMLELSKRMRSVLD